MHQKEHIMYVKNSRNYTLMEEIHKMIAKKNVVKTAESSLKMDISLDT